MKVEEISENAMHLGYLFFARDNNIKRTEKVQKEEEKYKIKPVEAIVEPWLGKYVDSYA